MGDKGYVEAVKWYRKAAEQNYAEAQFNLGLCYENGQGRCPKTGEASSDAHTRAFFNKGVWWMPPPGRGGRVGVASLAPALHASAFSSTQLGSKQDTKPSR